MKTYFAAYYCERQMIVKKTTSLSDAQCCVDYIDNNDIGSPVGIVDKETMKFVSVKHPYENQIKVQTLVIKSIENGEYSDYTPGDYEDVRRNSE